MKLTRSIGVSNFNETQLSAILELGLTAPAINQCEMSVGYHDDATIKFCKKNGITYEAYSPLGRGGAYPGCDPSDQRITRIAKAHNRSVYQVCLRWIVQQDMCLAVSSTKASHDTSDLALFDFELTPAEMATLASI